MHAFLFLAAGGEWAAGRAILGCGLTKERPRRLTTV